MKKSILIAMFIVPFLYVHSDDSFHSDDPFASIRKTKMNQFLDHFHLKFPLKEAYQVMPNMILAKLHDITENDYSFEIKKFNHNSIATGVVRCQGKEIANVDIVTRRNPQDAMSFLAEWVTSSSMPLTLILQNYTKLDNGCGELCFATSKNYDSRSGIMSHANGRFFFLRNGLIVRVINLSENCNVYAIADLLDRQIMKELKLNEDQLKELQKIKQGVDYDKLSNDLIEWKKDCHTRSDQNPFSSQIDFYTVKFEKILSNGPEIAAFMMQKYKSGDGELIVFFPKLFKVAFDSYFDEQKKVWIFPDYPQYVYYPAGFHPDRQKENNDGIWSYWWNNGRRSTVRIFEEKYKAFQSAKKTEKAENIKQAYIKLQNMGIIILPNLLEKIETGDSDLIPMFRCLSDRKELRTAEDCRRWWENNKEKYKDILEY